MFDVDDAYEDDDDVLDDVLDERRRRMTTTFDVERALARARARARAKTTSGRKNRLSEGMELKDDAFARRAFARRVADGDGEFVNDSGLDGGRDERMRQRRSIDRTSEREMNASEGERERDAGARAGRASASSLRDFDERLAKIRARTREAREEMDKIERMFRASERSSSAFVRGRVRDESTNVAGIGNEFDERIRSRDDGATRGTTTTRDEYVAPRENRMGSMTNVSNEPSIAVVARPRTPTGSMIHRPIPRRAGAPSASVEGTAWTAGGKSAPKGTTARFEFGSNMSVHSEDVDSRASAFKSLSMQDNRELEELRRLLAKTNVSEAATKRSADGMSTPPRIVGSPLRPPLARKARIRTFSEDLTRNRTSSVKLSQELRNSMLSQLTPVEHVAVEAELARAVRMSEISSEDLETANEEIARQYLSNRASADEMSWRNMNMTNEEEG